MGAIHVVAKPEVCFVVQAEEWALQDELRVGIPSCFHVYVFGACPKSERHKMEQRNCIMSK